MKKTNFIKFILLFLSYVTTVFSQNSLHLLVTMTGEKIGDLYGCVEGVGDINGDQFADFIVGSPETKYFNLYLGSKHFDTIPAGKFLFSQFKGIGDINKDGFDDILFLKSTLPDNLFGYRLIQVYAFFGGVEIDTNLVLIFERIYPTPTGPRLGKIGDVNNDGFPDFIIANSYEGDGYGRAYLYLGGVVINTSPFVTLVGQKRNDYFGDAICGIGDINNDSFGDFAIGAPAILGHPTDTPKVFIYYGGNTKDTIPKHTLTSEIYNPHSLFGRDLSNIGDINNDLHKEFMVSSAGESHLYISLDSVITFKGNWIGSGGDINNDGYSDFLIGDNNYKDSTGTIFGGVIRGYFGTPIFDTISDFYMSAETYAESFGKYVSVIGDINGDGYADVAVGGPAYPENQNTIGKVYIYSYKTTDGVNEENKNEVPQQFELKQNYPNPFNGETVIEFEIEKTEFVTLEVYNVLGQKIHVLEYGILNEGNHTIRFNAVGLPSGVYFYHLKTNHASIQKVMLLLK